MNRRRFFQLSNQVITRSIFSMVTMKGLLSSTALTIGSTMANTIRRANSRLGFNSINYLEAIDKTFNLGHTTLPATGVLLKIPKKLQQNQLVPIVVDASQRKKVSAIALVIDNNSKPLVGVWYFTGTALPYIATRVKVQQTSQIRAILVIDNHLEEIASLLNIV